MHFSGIFSIRQFILATINPFNVLFPPGIVIISRPFGDLLLSPVTCEKMKAGDKKNSHYCRPSHPTLNLLLLFDFSMSDSQFYENQKKKSPVMAYNEGRGQ